MPVLLADLVAASRRVSATPARSRKVAVLAELLRSLPGDEVTAAVALLSGEPRQGRIGIGWATLSAVAVAPAADPSLTVGDLDRALDALAALEGPGSGSARAQALADLLRRATEAEADFLRRLLLGELRQGALEGVMVDAVARAAGVPPAVVRRAAMLAGDLAEVAALALGGGEEALAAVRLRLLCPLQPMLPRRRPTSPPLCRRRARPRWSGSWTAPASRSTARVTGRGSSPATCATSPTACPPSCPWSVPCRPPASSSTERPWGGERTTAPTASRTR